VAESRTGADSFIEQLAAADVRWIFGNPGTNEQPLLGRLREHPELTYILALHEAVAVGAAEGYARASGRVGVVQVHAGPGLGNGIGMLHNARAGQTPLVVYVGQAERASLYLEPTLGADLVGEAAPVAKWAYEVRTPDEIPQVVRRALKVAMAPPRGPVVLSIPMDVMEQPTDAPVVAPTYVATRVRPDPEAVEQAASVIAAAAAPVVLAGDGIVTSGAIGAVGRFARAIGAPIYGAFTSEVCVDPNEPLNAGRLPSIEGAATLRALEPYDVVIAVGTKVFAHVFPTVGLPLGERRLVHIGLDPWELGKNQPGTLLLGDERASLDALIERLTRDDTFDDAEILARCAAAESRIAAAADAARSRDRARWDDQPMSTERAVAEIAAVVPPDTRLVDESLSGYGAVARAFAPRPGGWFRLRGGGIGAGMPLPIGVCLADHERPVVSLVGDGAAVYTISALWTAAHHRIPVVWGILNNRSYRTLKENAGRGERAAFVAGSDLTDPELDFVAIAHGMGVEARRVEHPDEVGPAFRAALETGRPALIDISIGGQAGSPTGPSGAGT
jgi:benzoylformate decarboxylase